MFRATEDVTSWLPDLSARAFSRAGASGAWSPKSLASSMEGATGIESVPSVWKSDPGGCLQFLVIMEKCLQAPVLLACRELARDG